MKALLMLLALTFSSFVLAHPPGVYMLDGDRNVTVTFANIAVCPNVAGALPGKLKTLTFSAQAKASPYGFVTGFYVEVHEGSEEIYVQTNNSCVPLEGGERYSASSDSFDVFSMQRI